MIINHMLQQEKYMTIQSDEIGECKYERTAIQKKES